MCHRWWCPDSCVTDRQRALRYAEGVEEERTLTGERWVHQWQVDVDPTCCLHTGITGLSSQSQHSFLDHVPIYTGQWRISCNHLHLERRHGGQTVRRATWGSLHADYRINPTYSYARGHQRGKRENKRRPQHFHLTHRAPSLMASSKGAPKRKEGDPPTTQASTAVARSSRPRVASRAQGTGAAKIR